MHTVTITLRGADFAHEMLELRTWLDQHMLEPVRFTYRQDGELVVISVEFQKDHHAETFRNRFGRLSDADALLRSGHDPLIRAMGHGLGRAEIPATMAQACWWRLLAEEIRTEADSFASETAKETMEVAARGWEQLAEELEHRLARKVGQPQVLPAEAGLHRHEAASVPSEQGQKSFRPLKSPTRSSTIP